MKSPVRGIKVGLSAGLVKKQLKIHEIFSQNIIQQKGGNQGKQCDARVEGGWRRGLRLATHSTCDPAATAACGGCSASGLLGTESAVQGTGRVHVTPAESEPGDVGGI